MSYLLDALNKAERERKLGQVPSLEGAESLAPPEARRNLWPWVALAAVVINAALIGLVVWPRSAPPPAMPVAKEVERPAVPPAPVAPVASVSPPIVAAPIPSPQASAPESAATVAAPNPAPSELNSSIQDAAQKPNDVAATPALSNKLPLERLPLLVEKSPEFQQALPNITVDVHVYDDDPRSRFVLINLQKRREGDEAASGVRIERITKEGLVLAFRGESFRFLMPH